MTYLPPLDLVVLLEFAPADHDGWRYYFPEDPEDYLQLTFGAETGLTVLSDNSVLADGSCFKSCEYADKLPGLDYLLRLLTYCNWDFPDAFADEDAFVAHLVEKGFLAARTKEEGGPAL